MLFQQSDLVGEKGLDEDGRSMKYVKFLQDSGLFSFSSKLKSFFQTEELKTIGIEEGGACFGLCLDWGRRILLERSGYFAKKFNPKKGAHARKKLLEKAYAIQTAAEKARLNSNVSLSEVGLKDAYSAMVGSLQKVKPSGYKLPLLTLSRSQLTLQGDNTWAHYSDMYTKLSSALGLLKGGAGMIISFVPYSYGPAGHSVGVVHPKNSMLYFDPNIGQREFTSHVADNVADAASASWVCNYQHCRILRMETVNVKDTSDDGKEEIM